MVVEQKLGDNTAAVLCCIVREQPSSSNSENRNSAECLLVRCHWFLMIHLEKEPFSHLKIAMLKNRQANKDEVL